MSEQERILSALKTWPYLKELGDQESGICPSWTPEPQAVSFLVRKQAFGCRPTVHRRAQMIISVKGCGIVEVDGLQWNISPGDAVLVAPFQRHHYPKFADKDICWLFLHWIGAKSERLGELRDRVLHLDTNAWQRLGGFIDAANASLAGHHDQGGECNHWLALLLCALRRGTCTTTATQNPTFDLVQRCRALINDWIAKPFTLTELAQELGVSEVHLRREYRHSTNSSLGFTVRAIRLERARHLLQHSQLSIAEIAAACGFASLGAFGRAFRVANGMSARAWRERLISSDLRKLS